MSMRAVSAKALYILLLYMLLPFAFPFSRRPLVQGDHHLHEITQGAAALYPGLCAFALTARMDNVHLHPGCRCALPWAMCFCTYSAYWSMYFLRASSQSKSGTGSIFGYEGTFYAKLCIGDCKALRWLLQSFALAVAKLCVGSCKALRRKVQCFA